MAQKSRAGAGVVKDATPFFSIFTNLQISAVEKFDLIFSRNHRMAKYFLNAAEIRVSKNWQKGPLSKIISLKKRESLS